MNLTKEEQDRLLAEAKENGRGFHVWQNGQWAEIIPNETDALVKSDDPHIDFDKILELGITNQSIKSEIDHLKSEITRLEVELKEANKKLEPYEKVKINLINWFKKNICTSPDNIIFSVTESGKWCVANINDNPMQHGAGEIHVFTPQQFVEANKPF